MKKKQPTDYPQLAFRISSEDKAKINKLVEEIVNASNDRLDDDQRVFRKNDVFVDALYLGLLTLKKNGHRLTRGPRR